MDLPSIADVNATRVAKFKRRVTAALERGVPDLYRGVVEELVRDTGAQLADIGAALASLAQGKSPLLMGDADTKAHSNHDAHESKHQPAPDRVSRADSAGGHTSASRPRSGRFAPQDSYRLEVGRVHGVQAGNIVGAIAHEAGLDGAEINGLKVREDHSVVRLPAGMPPDVLQRLAAVRVRGRPLAITRLEGPRSMREPPHKRTRNERHRP